MLYSQIVIKFYRQIFQLTIKLMSCETESSKMIFIALSDYELNFEATMY